MRRKESVLIKNKKTILHKSFAMALAAAISITAAGCSGGAHTSSAPSDAPQAATEAAAVPSAPAADTAAAAETAKPAETAAAETSTASASAAAEADTAAEAAAAAAAETADTAATASETAAADETFSTAEDASADPETDSSKSDAAEAIKDGVPRRDKADTALKESVLSETLVECTGWGQSAGSSLHAAAASVMLLQWANDVDAANVDSKLLADTVKAEVNRLSDTQQENLKENWSSISFDASMILDSYDEIAPTLEDAGCADAAKNLAGSKNTLANWEAAEHALNAVLK